jgi:tetratricopeptide (TPR) repeat protein
MVEDIQAPQSLQKSPDEYFRIALDAVKDVMGIETTPDQAALLLIKAGKACLLSGEWAQALESYQQALELCKSDEIKAEVLKHIGHIRTKQGQWKGASEAYEASLKILNRLGNLHEAGINYNSIGYICFETGDMTGAKEYYDKALRIANECNDAQLTADAQSNLGILSNVMGQTDDALSYYSQCIPIYETMGDIHGLAQVYHNLAMTYVDREEWQLAGEHYQKSIELCIKVGDLDLLSIIYVNRAQLALHLHDPYVAKTYCNKAFGIFEKTLNYMGIAEAYKLYGIIYSRMQDWNSAGVSFQKGIQICETYENHLTKAEIYYELGSMRQQEKKEVLVHLQKAVEIYEFLGIEKEVSKIKDEIRTLTA